MNKILFIDRGQLGQLTDTLKYCEYLNKKYSIEYLCFDEKYPYIDLPNVNVTYVSLVGPKLLRGIRFILKAIGKILKFNGFIFIVYFPGCGIIKKFLFWKKIHVDIRTLSVAKEKDVRDKENVQISRDIDSFNTISCISEGVAKQLEFNKKLQVYILPLGADIVSDSNKNFQNIKLLYIGTLNNRNIIQTVEGVAMYIKKHPDRFITYDIIGSGEEYEKIQEYIRLYKLETYIILHGKIPHSLLKPFLDRCNIGVSYVPIVDYYEFQPPTKTFEYTLSGLYCIATATEANKQIINSENGVLIDDSPEGFVDGLESMWHIKDKINSTVIRNTMKKYSWSNIIKQYLMPIINQTEV